MSTRTLIQTCMLGSIVWFALFRLYQISSNLYRKHLMLLIVLNCFLIHMLINTVFFIYWEDTLKFQISDFQISWFSSFNYLNILVNCIACIQVQVIVPQAYFTFYSVNSYSFYHKSNFSFILNIKNINHSCLVLSCQWLAELCL